MMNVSLACLRFGLGGDLRQTLFATRLRRCAAQRQTRGIAAYGYEQAKALVFADYGEPKDVLQYVRAQTLIQIGLFIRKLTHNCKDFTSTPFPHHTAIF